MMGPRQVEQGALFYNFSLYAQCQRTTCWGRSTKRSQPRRTATECQRLISRPPIVLYVRHSI
jgi:hypothetical protein